MRVFATGWSEGYDGPGRRWVVYSKGCNLRCRWCANPEGISPKPQVLFYATRGQGSAKVCPHGAISEDPNGREPAIDRSLCKTCQDHACVTLWRHPALAFAGEELSPVAIVKYAVRSRALFGPAGGVTFGGGEATLQLAQLRDSLSRLHAAGIHTALETNATSAALPTLFDCVDLLICDLKCVSGERHRTWTSADNSTALANIALAAHHKPDVWIRVPLVPGLNTDPGERKRILDFLRKLRSLRQSLTVELLHLHHNGEPKYRALGWDYPMAGAPEMPEGLAAEFQDELTAAGIDARCATQEWQYEYHG